MSGALLTADALAFAHPGHAPLFADLSFALAPGLTLVRGGDGRGKTTLLRLLAGELTPTAGRIERRADGIWHAAPLAADSDAIVAADWLGAQRARHGAWSAATEAALVDGFALAEHLSKPLYMLSAGSRRKVGLVAAAASGAAITLLDTPYAALDARSARMLTALLAEAAASTGRAWVLADYALPAGLEAAAFAGMIELGD